MLNLANLVRRPVTILSRIAHLCWSSPSAWCPRASRIGPNSKSWAQYLASYVTMQDW